MAKQDVNFVDKHIEKVVLGTCGAVLLGALWFAFGGTRFAVNEKSPAELNKALAEATEATRQQVLSARYNPPKKESANPQDDPVAQLGEWFGESAKGLKTIAGLQEQHPRAHIFPPQFISVMKTSLEDRHELARLVAPGLPVVTSGRTNFKLYREPMDMTGYDPKNNWYGMEEFEGTRSWVTIAAQVDLTEQKARFIEQNYPTSAGLEIVRVHLQRKDLSDPSAGWQDVDGFVPYIPQKRPAVVVQPDGRTRIDGLEDYRSKMQQHESLVIAPPLPVRLTGDKPELPPLPYLDERPETNRAATPEEASKRLKKWLELSRAALAGKRPFKEADINAAIILAKAAVAMTSAKPQDLEAAKVQLNKVIEKAPKSLKGEAKGRPHPPESLMPVVAHDMGPLPGHVYVYRMRYEALNYYAGSPSELRNPRDAAKLTVFSEWSPESRPVEITTDVYFYLTKADKAKKEVVVSVFRVSKSNTQKQEYRISPGEEIGRKEKTGNKGDFSTGTVCVDIDFSREIDGKKETILVYADKADGSLHEKVLSRDLKDKIYKRHLGKGEVKTAQP